MDLEVKIAGDVIFSGNPGNKMREWRNMFNITQKRLATEMKVSPSVISDYETGRRGNPGANMIKRYVHALIEIDKGRGGDFINKYSAMRLLKEGKGIISIREFAESISVREFCKMIGAKILVKGDLDKKIYGYTLVDAKKGALEMSSWEIARMYGRSPGRALVLTNLFSGRASTYGIKVASIVGFRPSLVILNLKGEVRFAKKIAKDLRLTLAVLREDTESVIESLQKIK